MTSFFTELKRRNVFKVAVAYAIVAWLLIQIVATVVPMFGAPDWVTRTLTFIILLGFPIAVFFAWAYEITPEGVKPTHQVDAAESITATTGRKIDFVIIGFLALAVIYLLVDRLSVEDALEPEVAAISEVMPAEPAVSGPPAEPEREAPPKIPNSVAVLPLENLSPDPDEAYFATGIHEEILNQLAKLRNLNVLARTTMRQYQDTDKSIQQIADELNVESVIEGSVRYADDRVRVTVQLIEAETGTHLWSDTYDSEFKDIFAIESDIAMNVANVLEAEFSLEEQASIEEVPTASPAAYALYLRSFGGGSDILNFGTVEERIASIDRAIELDPGFAQAYTRKANLVLNLNQYSPPDEWYANEELARGYAERALELDPNLGGAYSVIGRIYFSNWQIERANEAFERALDLSPNAPGLTSAAFVSRMLLGLGEGNNFSLEGLRAIGSLHAAAYWHALRGDFETATSTFLENLEKNPLAANSYFELSRIESRNRNYEQAIEYARTAETISTNPSTTGLSILVYTYGLAGSHTDAMRLFDVLMERSETQAVTSISWALAYLGIGDSDKALPYLRELVENRRLNPPTVEHMVVWKNVFEDPVLEEPEFVEMRARMGEFE